MTVCRLLAVSSKNPVGVVRHLEAFARLCRESREYQGHGWGCAVWRNGFWERYRSITPVWEDPYRPEGEVRTFVAHARSAFRNEGILVENNMPYVQGDRAFVFNGELRGVRLAMEGRTGAERIFTLIQNLDRGDLGESVHKSISILRKRTAHIRACNFIVAEPGRFHIHSLFDGEEDYFTMFMRTDGPEMVVCSEKYPGDDRGWVPVPNDALQVLPC